MIEFGRAGERPATGIFRARDLAGEPLPGRCRRANDALRHARAGHRAVHAGDCERARLARSLQSREGVAEGRGIPGRVAQPVRQSRACGRRLQCGAPPGAGMARGHRRMPAETRNYVRAITGSSVEDWAKAGKGGKTPESAPPTTCRDLMALLKQAPNPFVIRLEEQVKLAAGKTWGVQLAAGFDRNKALAMYGRAVRNLSGVIGDRDPSILSSVQRSRGAHVVLSGADRADTRPEAEGLCDRIRRSGGACFVLRNMFVRG